MGSAKGQLISKCLFGIFNSPKKRTKTFFFSSFLGELKIPNWHFEINWPLGKKQTIKIADGSFEARSNISRNIKNQTERMLYPKDCLCQINMKLNIIRWNCWNLQRIRRKPGLCLMDYNCSKYCHFVQIYQIVLWKMSKLNEFIIVAVISNYVSRNFLHCFGADNVANLHLTEES